MSDLASRMYPDAAPAKSPPPAQPETAQPRGSQGAQQAESARQAAAPSIPQRGIAERMYQSTQPAEAPASEVAPTEQASPPAAPPVDAEVAAVRGWFTVDESSPPPLSVAELVDSPTDLFERAAGDAARPADASGYGHTLGQGFDLLERDARAEGDTEGTAALLSGRQEAAAVLFDLGVPKQAAAEFTRVLAEAHAHGPVPEEARWQAQDATLAQLKREWGRQTEARIVLARQAADAACQRLPWLRELLANGAGNNPALIRHFADIGLRQARKAKAGRR